MQMKKVRDCKNITFNVREQNITVHVRQPMADIVCEHAEEVKSAYMGGYGSYYIRNKETQKWININSATARKLTKYLRHAWQDLEADYYWLDIKPFSK